MNRMNRRTFMKKAVYLGAGLIAMAGIGVGWKVVKSTLVKPEVAGSPPQRNPGHFKDDSHWFTLAELATIKALASVIVPSDGNGPGAAEADVAGQLDQMVASTPRKQELYRAGLAEIDEVAMHQYQQQFSKLGMKEQIELFSLVDGAMQAMEKEPVSIMDKASRKIHFLYYFKWQGVSPRAADFCHYLLLDVKEKFYISQPAWAWLGYEGPPFPLGYFSQPDNCPVRKV
jgi:hypothetical protein